MPEVKNALPAGKLLKSSRNTYRVMKVLGSGGFGITYLVQAQVQENGDIVTYYFAMKEHFIQRVCERSTENSSILFSNPVRDEVENSMKDFMAEASRLQLVGGRHDNIVKVVDIFQANNTAYYVMDYLHGKSLRNYVAERGPLSPAEAKAIMTPVIDAIGFLHANNMTHLDIKPDNIMIVTGADGRPQPVLIDFGLSKHYDDNGTPTSTINTLACSDGYSPVEQYGGITTFSPTADIYALGATMLFSLTGTNPKKSTDMSVRDLQASLANIPDPALAGVIGAMMQQDRFSRPSSVKDILAAMNNPVQPQPMQAVNGGAVPPAPPVPPRPQPGVGAPRNVRPIKAQKSAKLPLIIGLCVGIPVLLGIIGTVLYFIFSGGSDIKDYDRGYNVSQYVNLDVDGTTPSVTLEDPEVPMGVALRWDADIDLDLLINTPAGTDVYFANQEDQETGGAFGEDQLSGPDAVEGIDFYSPRRGKYDVFVNVRGSLPEEGIPASILVWNNNEWKAYDFTLKPNDEDVNYYYITSVNVSRDIDGSIPVESSSSSSSSSSSGSGWGYVESGTQSYSSGNNISSYRQAHPWNGQDSEAQRRAASLSGSGPVKVSLLWDGNNDLDLYVNSATGEDIYYGNRTGNGGASHTGDNYGSGNNNYESVSFSNPTSGIYDVFVRCRGSVPSDGLPVKVVVKNGNHISTYRVKLPEGNGEDYRIVQFDYEGGSSSGSSSSSSSSDSNAPITLASSSNTGNISYSNTVTDFVRCNVSETHNTALEQRARNLSGSGRLRITAFWDFSSDVDLIISTPDGDDVYFARTSDSTTGGHFSGDQMGGNGSYESVYFTNPARGYYDIFVRCRGSVPSSGGLITVVVNDGSTNKTYSTRIKMGSSSLKDFKIAGYNY